MASFSNVKDAVLRSGNTLGEDQRHYDHNINAENWLTRRARDGESVCEMGKCA